MIIYYIQFLSTTKFFVNILAYDKKITYISIRHKIEYIRSHDKIKLI